MIIPSGHAAAAADAADAGQGWVGTWLDNAALATVAPAVAASFASPLGLGAGGCAPHCASDHGLSGSSC